MDDYKLEDSVQEDEARWDVFAESRSYKSLYSWLVHFQSKGIKAEIKKTGSNQLKPYQLWIFRRWWKARAEARFKAGKEKGKIWNSTKGKNARLREEKD